MIEKIAIIDSGQMGAGIAHVCALAGLNIIMTDISDAKLEHGIETINGILDHQIARGKISVSDKDSALARIQTSIPLHILTDVDLVIEEVSEKEEVKREIFKKLTGILK